ncbi:anti-sigma factor [Streptomyces sp. NPDC005574]|uniref:anti-sigma factor n=1 Tax=Streptomyces sp. NPDC005574 TaxID=3156891 RepID=UPI0033B9B185
MPNTGQGGHGPPHEPLALRPARAACLGAAVALGGVAAWQSTRAHDARAALTREEAGAATFADIPAARDATVSTRALADGGRISVVASRSRGRAAAVATDQPRLGGDRVHELWYAETTGVLRPAGLLPGSGGRAARVLAGELGDAGAVGVTVEPAGGSRQPTGAPLGIVTVPWGTGRVVGHLAERSAHRFLPAVAEWRSTTRSAREPVGMGPARSRPNCLPVQRNGRGWSHDRGSE